MDYIDLSLNGTLEKRFDPQRFVTFRDGYFDVVNSYLFQNILKLKPIGIYLILDTPNRPDTISYDIYGDTQFWYLLMLYNNVIDLDELPLNKKINFFSLSDLDELFFSLSRLSLPTPVRI